MTTRTIGFLFALCISLAGCLESEEPLCKTSARDDRLLGHWSAIAPETGKLEITSVENGGYTIVAKDHGLTTDKSKDIVPFETALCETPAAHYVNLKVDPTLGEKKAFTFFRYEIASDGVLHVYALKPEVLKIAIKTGVLKGKVTKESWSSSVLLSSAGTDLLKWLDAQKLSAAYGDPISYKKENGTAVH